jgi:membrane-associated phospholipid phosphatase
MSKPVYLIQAAYVTVLLGIFVVRGIGLTPDIIFLILAALALASKGTRWPFIRDFGPFVLLLLSYDAMRGFADDLGGRPYVAYPISIDRALFGEVPTITLQNWLFDPGQTHWYDYAAAMLHVVHFIVPLIFAAVLWQHYKSQYWTFVISLLVLSYAGFATFMLLPTAPPWYASLVAGTLPDVNLVHESFPALTVAYLFLSPNPVAAMPSLHAGYPWLFMLFAFRVWGWKAAPFTIYVGAVYFSIMYLGHHYAIDVIAGVAYASAAYVLCATPVLRRSYNWVRSRWQEPTPATAVSIPVPTDEAA